MTSCVPSLTTRQTTIDEQHASMMLTFASTAPLQLPKAERCALCRRRSTRRTPVARAARRPNADAELSTLESGVLNAAMALGKACEYRVEKYEQQATALFEEATRAAEELEKTSKGFGASASAGARLRQRLIGRWLLLYTDSQAVVKNGGSITGLGNLPGARCKRVEVHLEASGKARTIESVTAFGFVDGENALIGKWTLGGKAGATLEVTYAEALLLGKATLRANSKAVLETTYVGENVRVGRAASGDLFVFQRLNKVAV